MVMAAPSLSLVAHPSRCLRVLGSGRLCGAIVTPEGPRSYPPSGRRMWPAVAGRRVGWGAGVLAAAAAQPGLAG